MSDDRLNELAPCPFCGGKMKHYSADGAEWWGHPTWGDRPAENADELIRCPAYGWRAYDSELDRLAAWNRRSALEPSPAMPHEFTPEQLADLYGGEIAERWKLGDAVPAIKLIVQQVVEHDRRHASPAPKIAPDLTAKAWEIIGEHMSPEQMVADPEALALDIAATFEAIKHGCTLTASPSPAPVEAEVREASNSVADAWSAIATERNRQIEDEGWTAEHDDQHNEGEMLSAAVAYMWHGTEKGTSDGSRPGNWPWSAEWWKPMDRRRNLVRAGALCLAERERRLRAHLHPGPADHKLGIALRELAALSPAQPGAQNNGVAGEAK